MGDFWHGLFKTLVVSTWGAKSHGIFLQPHRGIACKIFFLPCLLVLVRLSCIVPVLLAFIIAFHSISDSSVIVLLKLCSFHSISDCSVIVLMYLGSIATRASAFDRCIAISPAVFFQRHRPATFSLWIAFIFFNHIAFVLYFNTLQTALLLYFFEIWHLSNQS